MSPFVSDWLPSYCPSQLALQWLAFCIWSLQLTVWFILEKCHGFMWSVPVGSYRHDCTLLQWPKCGQPLQAQPVSEIWINSSIPISLSPSTSSNITGLGHQSQQLSGQQKSNLGTLASEAKTLNKSYYTVKLPCVGLFRNFLRLILF